MKGNLNGEHNRHERQESKEQWDRLQKQVRPQGGLKENEPPRHTAEQRACACNEQASGRHPQHSKAKEINFEEGKRAAAAKKAGGAVSEPASMRQRANCA